MQCSKEKWKQEIKEKIRNKAKDYIETEINNTSRYKNNIKDEIVVGKRKRYAVLSQKKAKVWFRLRTDLIDPTPREPYHPESKWKCKFCSAREQGTEHYVRFCPGTAKILEEWDRDALFQFIQKLDGPDNYFYGATIVLEKLYFSLKN